MKFYSLLFFVVLLAINSHGQFSADPNNPFVVSAEIGSQTKVKSFEDGNDGIYIFWMDERDGTSNTKIYGQHIDLNGNPLWTEGGKLIAAGDYDIEVYNVVRFDNGTIMLLWSEGGDPVLTNNKCYARKLDDNGDPVWNSDTAMAERNLGTASIFVFHDIEVIQDSYGYRILMFIETYGYNRIRMSRLDSNGGLQMSYNGVEIGPISFGQVHMTSDDGDGAYVYYSTGNGAGAIVKIMHITGNATLSWPDWVNMNEGTDGLYYQFSVIGDANGATMLWVGGGTNAEDLKVRRILSNGTFDWNGDTKVICDAAGSQEIFDWIKVGNDYYTSWIDGRPGVIGNYALYGMRFDINGNMLWNEDGNLLIDASSYLPRPRIFESAAGSIVAVYQSSTLGMVYQKIDSQGNTLLPIEGTSIASNPFCTYTYDDFDLVSAGSHVLCTWSAEITAPQARNIFMNQLFDETVYTNVNYDLIWCDSVTFGNYGTFTESGVYTFEEPGDTIVTINVTINQSSHEEFIVNACNSYNWHGTEYVTSGDYNFDMVSAQGCDSTETLHLTLDSYTPNLIVDGNEITCDDPNAVVVWYNCDFNTPVATGSTYTITQSGHYGFVATSGDCIFESPCEQVNYISVENVDATMFHCFPNPGNHHLILATKSNSPFQFSVFTIDGQLKIQGYSYSTPYIIDTDAWPVGMFMIEWQQGNDHAHQFWVKQ